MTDLRHLSREEQKLLADVTLLVQNDDQEFNYEMLKAAAPDEASGEFWFRMAETLSTLPPNRSLDFAPERRQADGCRVDFVGIAARQPRDSAALGAKGDCAQLLGTRASDPRARFGAAGGQSGGGQRGRVFGEDFIAKPAFHFERRIGAVSRRHMVCRNAR